MMRSSIIGASTLLNVLIQHLPLQSLFWSKIWRACRASDPNTTNIQLRLKVLNIIEESAKFKYTQAKNEEIVTRPSSSSEDVVL